MSWKDTRILIVGAAGGIGEAVAMHFHGLGGRVLEADLAREQWPRGVAGRLTVDVTESDSVEAMVKAAAHGLGGLDVVVNCTGVLGPVKPSHELEMSEFEHVERVNLYGAFAISRATLPVLLSSSRGRLIHLSSIAGKEGNPQMAAYSASKAGVIGLVKALGKEYAATSVTVNAIAPAVIDTPLIKAMGAERIELQRALVPKGRLGAPSEVACLVQYIASESSSFTTGFTYDLSGGRADF